MSQTKPSDLLFDPALIPSKVQSLLGDDLLVSSATRQLEMILTDSQLRPLASDDQTRGFFELLSVLTAAPKLSAQKFKGNVAFYSQLPSVLQSQADNHV